MLLLSFIMRKNTKHCCLFFLLVALCSACVSTKNITYFQGPGIDTVRFSTLKTVVPHEPKIQPDDVLAIIVNSMSEESNVLLNFQNITPINTTNLPGGFAGANRTQPLGYLVDANGNIELPMVGKINVVNKTTDAASEVIKTELLKVIKTPVVNVRIMNQKFTILGEVNRPGSYNLVSNTMTLPEVLGAAGDLTVFGRRDNVMLIRTDANKERHIVRLDLLSRNVLESPYYFIQNNDVIYVEATQGRVTSSDRTLQMIPIVTGITTSFVLLLNLLFK